MKKFIYFAAALLGLASCTSDDYIGDQGLREANENKAISFGFDVTNTTRAAGTADDAARLGYSFAVYGTKTVSGTVSNVFAQTPYAAATTDYSSNTYWAWYNDNTAQTTTSNTHNWEYVGTAGNKTLPNSGTFNLGSDQTIKYWDYAASKYEFVAYKATVGNPTISNYTTSGFTVAGTAEQLAGLYIADKVTVTTANLTPSQPGTLPAAETQIGDVVQFTFRAGATKVRLGIYETIPGYDVKNVNFRPSNNEFSATTTNAKLNGSFNGTGSSASGTYNVTYNATTGVAEYDNTAASANDYFDFGGFTSSTKLGETSTSPTWATGSTNYSSVLPNQDNYSNMTLIIDYQLYNSTTQETINVKGAKAVVPAIYMKWNPNYTYTYLFKISDNTNGTTGTEGTSPEGLFPITFDAVSIVADTNKEGSTTIVHTPSITTYQDGSVSTAGITYATISKPIYVTVNTDGTLATLTASGTGTNIALYTVDAGTTEADLMLTTKTKTAAAGLSVLSSATTVNSVTFGATTTAAFTPSATGTYAIEYDDGTTKHYKIIVVAASVPNP